MENTHNFISPRINLVGIGAIKDLSTQLLDYKLSKVLIVTDQNMKTLGYVEMIEKILKALFISYDVFDGVYHTNCMTSFVEDGLTYLDKGLNILARDYKFIISIGGGTVHDCAKAIAILATNDGKISDYEGYDKILKPTLKHIAINTTSGSGSELVDTTIVVDQTKKVKMVIKSPKILPFMSINDPIFMQTMPKGITASSGIDSISHAIEAYVATEAFPITDSLALGALRLAYHYLPRAFDNGNDLEAREQMTYANIMAGMAFGNAGLGYVHSISHQLGGFYCETPHGQFNAVLLPHVFEFNSNSIPEDRILKIAEAMDIKTNDKFEAIEQIVIELKKLINYIGIPSHLRELGVDENDISEMSQNTMKDICCITNPRQGTADEVARILKSAM